MTIQELINMSVDSNVIVIESNSPSIENIVRATYNLGNEIKNLKSTMRAD